MKIVKEGMSGPASCLPAALAFGALWGSAEATLGHLLHMARIPGLAGLVMFPVALFFLARTYGAAGRLAVLPAAAAVAASLKLADAFLPGTDLWAVLNPAQAILLEGLAITGLFAASGNPIRLRPAPVVLTVLVWKFAFLPASFRPFFRLDSFLLEAAAQTVAILLLAAFAFDRSPSPAGPAFRPRPVAAVILGAAALAIETLF